MQPRVFNALPATPSATIVFHAALSTHISSNSVASPSPAPRPRVARKAALVVTEAAAARLKHLMQGQEQAIGIKIGVRQRGCNGYTCDTF